jgi:DNA-binding YbaB/EbfC family protein
MEEMQQKLGQITAEGAAGGGMVTAKMNGRMELLSCVISDEAMKLQDKEMLEDLIIAAINQAIVKLNQQRAEETARIAAEMGVPLPGGDGGIPGLM